MINHKYWYLIKLKNIEIRLYSVWLYEKDQFYNLWYFNVFNDFNDHLWQNKIKIHLNANNINVMKTLIF